MREFLEAAFPIAAAVTGAMLPFIGLALLILLVIFVWCFCGWVIEQVNYRELWHKTRSERDTARQLADTWKRECEQMAYEMRKEKR